MLPTAYALVVSAALLGGGDKDAPSGYLQVGKSGEEKKLVRYEPREGDLIFYDDKSIFWTVLFVWAGSGPPLHMGIVVKKADGTLAVLEAGPDDSLHVYLLDLDKRLPQFDKDFRGTISIRRCKKELTTEQSKALTKFAAAQEGKRYAVLRLLLQGTSFSCRGPIRELFLADTVLDRSSWICSELSVAAGTVAGLFPASVKANVTYPLDIVDNRRHNLSRVWHDAATWSASKR
jgi:hypothetical protein